ncbi:MAG: HAMP domain-containing sensor histidine kinase [Candidatus Absconditabacteria bacterium]
MKYQPQLNNLRNKFAFVFTFIIFCIILIVQIVYSGLRVYMGVKQQTGAMIQQRDLMNTAIITGRGTGRMGGLGGMNHSFEFRRKDFMGMPRTNMLLVRGNDIQSYIVDNISVEDMQHLIQNPQIGTYVDFITPGSKIYKTTINNNEYIYTVTRGDSKNGKFVFVIVDKLKLTLSDLLLENIYFLLIVLMFSFVIYQMGKYFVGLNLRPVKEKLEDMEDFVHNAGHELKTPLAVMSSGLQLSKLTKNFEPKVDESLSQIKYMEGLISSLIDLSEVDSITEREQIDVNQEISNIYNSLKSKAIEKNISIQISNSSPCKINANLGHFNVMISNIINNSIKYTNDGGQINIEVNKSYVKITDNGVGISKDNLENVFKRFFKEDNSRGSDGYGIGLSLVKKISNIYAWNVSIQSEKGQGTTVRVRF